MHCNDLTSLLGFARLCFTIYFPDVRVMVAVAMTVVVVALIIAFFVLLEVVVVVKVVGSRSR